ncbi:MAG: hypothetical protein HWN68_10270 [Desulfobacterales bacterium]|nr:hypothetical protein [Desulfobacterales bacterium]
MNDVIPINLAVEDPLSEIVVRVMLQQSGRHYAVGTCFGHYGFGYLKKRVNGFNNAAQGTPFLVLTDLDQTDCPPVLIREWFSSPIHNNLLFRIAVREVEAWLLAHRSAFAAFLGVREALVPDNPDELIDPKRSLIELTAKSRKRGIRDAIIPRAGSTARIGPDYNGQLISYVQNNWKAKEAINHSTSLSKAFHAIRTFQPIFRLQGDE